jgi:hypothetical protein
MPTNMMYKIMMREEMEHCEHLPVRMNVFCSHRPQSVPECLGRQVKFPKQASLFHVQKTILTGSDWLAQKPANKNYEIIHGRIGKARIYRFWGLVVPNCQCNWRLLDTANKDFRRGS